MNFNSVLDIFITFSNLPSQQASKFDFLIQSAINQVSSRLISPLNSQQDTLSASCLAAAIAFYSFTLINASSSPSSLKLDHFSCSASASELLKSALALKNHFISLASHLISDQNFCFRQVL